MKRILALVLALLSCVGLLSGCGGDTAGDPADAQTGDGPRPICRPGRPPSGEPPPAPASSASLRTVRPRLIRR